MARITVPCQVVEVPDKIEEEALAMADMTAKGAVKQFSNMFG